MGIESAKEVIKETVKEHPVEIALGSAAGMAFGIFAAVAIRKTHNHFTDQSEEENLEDLNGNS